MSGGSEVIFDDQTRDSDSDSDSDVPENETVLKCVQESDDQLEKEQNLLEEMDNSLEQLNKRQVYFPVSSFFNACLSLRLF